MYFQLLHLSGPHRGETDICRRRQVTIGTAFDATVRFPRGKPVARHHAEIDFVKRECAFHLTAREGRVFVNGREIREVILEHDDSIEIGLNGPKVRFQIQAGSTCKPVRQMLSDARQVRMERGLLAWLHALQGDLIRRSGWQLRLLMGTALIAIAFGAAYFGGILATKHAAARHELMRRQEAEGWNAQFGALREQLRRQWEDFRHEQAGKASREDLAELRTELARRAQVVDALVARNQALRQVLDVYSRGVCLIHGIFSLTQAASGTGQAASAPEPIQVEYFGSGFLATPQGQVITNRHVAEPWANDETIGRLLAQGFIPRFVELTATFPGQAPVPIDPASIQLSAEGVDVAVLRVQVQGVPVVPLFEGDVRTFRGGHVVLVGYPTGLNGVLARAEPELVTEALAHATDARTLIIELAARGAIVPVITQGALNEVREKRLVYDAETTFGGSGGPVFASDGTAIGVNFAVTRDFGGSNFGVPIEFARRMLP